MDDLLNKWIRKNYELDTIVSVKLLRSYTNDVYLIKTSVKKFVLKIYNNVWRTNPEVLWEIDLVKHISKKGSLVARTVLGKNGKEIQSFIQKGDTFSVVFFEYAPGSKPIPPFKSDLYYKLGIAAATLHKQSDDFYSSYPRPEINLKYLIEDSISLSKEFIKDKSSLNEYINFGIELETKLNYFIGRGLDWGPIHGDLTLDNIHITKEGIITFYDFDSSGFGWRAMELQGWAVTKPDNKTKLAAFLKGYKEIRNVNENDIIAAPYFAAAQDMWLRKGMKALYSPEILDQQLERVKEWAKYFKDNNLL